MKKLIKVHSSLAKRTFVTQSLKGRIFIMSLASQETDQPDPLRREIADHELEANAPNQSDMTQEIYQCKMARKSAKAFLTRKMNEITELTKAVSNVQRVQSAYCEFEEALRKFFLAHKTFHSKLSDEDDLEESKAYYEAELRRTSIFEDKIRTWINDNYIEGSCQTLYDGNDPSNEIKPSDSVSNVGKSYVSKTSRKSKGIRSEISSLSSRGSSKGSAVSAKAAAAAKKAVLEEEAIRLHKRQELQQRELLLQQQREELELETKIAQAAAEERTYSEIGYAVQNANINQRDKTYERSRAMPINSRLVPAFTPPSIAARPERSGVIPDVPKQLPSNQQVLSTPLNAQARAWNNNKDNVPTYQANASTNHAYE